MENKTVIIIAVATFVLGLIFGSGFSGKKEAPKAGAKELLTQAIQEIDTLEKDKQTLSKDLADAGSKKIAKENKGLKERIAAAQLNSESLQKEIQMLKGQLAHTKLQLEAKGDVRANINEQQTRLTELEKENQDLRVVIEQIRSLAKQKEAGISLQPQAEEKAGQLQEADIKAVPAAKEEAPVQHK